MKADHRAQHWEHFEHGADIGVRGYGDTRAEAFRQAAMALTAVVTDPARVDASQAVSVACQADDDEVLLVDWLNAIIYEMATREMLFSRFDLRLHDHRLEATLFGEAVDTAKHHPAVEIKGATFTQLRVAQNDDGIWLAQCVVDV